ncbi:sulfatase-like hydrolase/transferase [Paenibacillus sp. IB182496]|uniref:Sulfatase-like hydrolase/transferase n=1 Tax=Paenibacillus sabuli TaxID=2772509 RepID=A0A927GTU4_9BACL|nr:sulfatase-like hydrolase/transferase [Paenibacillus sabuli]MBD2847666.1 sulfatase-like hydrolase/transferase [Paenibacillus sabuli]
MTAKPHLILFNPDQWRGDVLGHMGDPAAATPHLDRLLGEGGVSFRHAYTQNPVCTPSRCAFMSGWYPHVRGHRSMFHMMGPDEPVLLRHLKDNGYYVWWGGKNDLVPSDADFSRYCDVKHDPGPVRAMFAMDRERQWRGSPEGDAYYSFYVGRLEAERESGTYPDSDWAHIREAVRVIRDRPADRPLCLYLPLTYPHPPYAVEEPWFSLIDRDRLPPRRVLEAAALQDKPAMTRGLREALGLGGWDEARWRELRATYYGMCARVDHQFGMLVEALKQAGIYEDTAILVFSDHGDYTGDYNLVEKAQNTFEDCLVQVPLLIKPQRGIDVKPGIHEALVELIDLPATVAELTGLPLDYTQFGRSLVPLLTGEAAEHRDAVFAEGGRLPEETHCMDVTPENQDPAFLYYARAQLHRSSGPAHIKATMCRTKAYKYVRRLAEKDELYDLARDPGELVNCIDRPEYAGAVMQMQQRMLRYYQETSDVVPWQPSRR